MEPFISQTGLVVNDPKFCVKGSNFGCICPDCKGEQKLFIEEMMNDWDGLWARRKEMYLANRTKWQKFKDWIKGKLTPTNTQ